MSWYLALHPENLVKSLVKMWPSGSQYQSAGSTCSESRNTLGLSINNDSSLGPHFNQTKIKNYFRYGSVKSAHRRTGKIKGIERILGTMDQLQESLIEVTSGQAKYEHHHRAIVWRCPRLPKEGQGK